MSVSKFSLTVVAVSFVFFVALLLLIPLASGFLDQAVLAGLTWGHLLVIVIHVFPVIAAWIYIRNSGELT